MWKIRLHNLWQWGLHLYCPLQKILLKLHLHILGDRHAHTMVHLWQLEDNSQESVLFYHMGHGAQTQAIRLGGKCLDQQSHLTTCCLVVSSRICLIKWDILFRNRFTGS